MKKQVKVSGGGTEGEEWVACTVKVMPSTNVFWRRMKADKVFTDIQEAIDSLA